MKYRLLALLMIIAGCTPDRPCPFSIGKMETADRIVAPFHSIHVFDGFEVEWYADTTYHVEITTGKNLWKGTSWDVKNGILELQDNNRCLWLRDLSFRPKAKIFSPDNAVNIIRHYGSEDLRIVDTLRSDSMVYEGWDTSGDFFHLGRHRQLFIKSNTGPSIVRASGSTQYLYVYNSSVGDVYTENMSAQNGLIINRNIGLIRVHMKKRADLVIDDAGDIAYNRSIDSVRVWRNGPGRAIPY